MSYRPSLLTNPFIRNFYDPEIRILDFPVSFYLEYPFKTPGPLVCTVQALVEEALLEIHPSAIDLGICLTTTTVRKRINIKNISIVPQQIGFVDMPKVFILLYKLNTLTLHSIKLLRAIIYFT